MKTFKGEVGGKQFYFKSIGESYLIEPYQQTGVKSFNVIRRPKEDADGGKNREWIISSNVTDTLKKLEPDFSAFIEDRTDKDA